MTFLIWATAAVAAVTFYVHTFIGGRVVAAPLLADTNLPKASKWLTYYCWHITSIYIFISVGCLVWIALNPAETFALAVISLQTCCFAILSIAVAIKGGIPPWKFPSTSLFAATALLCWAALMI
jgi:hypothetical protein